MTLLASAVAESFRYYPTQQVSLPERVAIRLPTADLALTIDLGTVQINRLAGNPQQLWAMPTFEGYAQYDLSGAAPGTPLPGRPATSSYSPTQPTAVSTVLPMATFRSTPADPTANCLPAGGVVQTMPADVLRRAGTWLAATSRQSNSRELRLPQRKGRQGRHSVPGSKPGRPARHPSNLASSVAGSLPRRLCLPILMVAACCSPGGFSALRQIV